ARDVAFGRGRHSCCAAGQRNLHECHVRLRLNHALRVARSLLALLRPPPRRNTDVEHAEGTPMLALSVQPLRKDSATLEEFPEPQPASGETHVQLRALDIGICG